MSTLKVNNIQNASGGSNSTPDEIESGRLKAWGSFKGSGTVSIHASYNFSSITDISAGRYRLTFTNAMSDTNYALSGNTMKGDSNNDGNAKIQLGGCDGTPAENTGNFEARTLASHLDHNDPDKFWVMVAR